MCETYMFTFKGIKKTKNEANCRYCKYRMSEPNKKKEIWCDYTGVNIIPIMLIVSHKNCNHFKWEFLKNIK